MKSIPVFAILALLLIGCGGDADIKIINNTSRYASGDVDGQSFGVVTGGTTKRTIEVGSFWSSSSDVEINVNYHYTEKSGSGVKTRHHEKMEMKADCEYTYELYSYAPGKYGLRLLMAEPGSMIFAP